MEFWVSMLSGGIAGGIEMVTIWPMEYAKTQLQLQEQLKVNSNAKFKGLYDCLKQTINKNGFFGLYRGLSPMLTMAIPKAGLRFGTFSYLQNKLKDDGKISIGKNFIAGLGAGFVEATIIVTPTETVKTKLIKDNKPLFSGLTSIIKSEGIRGIYKGLPSTILKQSSNQGIRFTIFNAYKDYIGPIHFNPLNKFIGGSLAGLIGVLLNNPFDVVKTKIQGSEITKYKNTFHCFKDIVSKEGITVLWRGTIPRLGRVVPGQGIMFMTYDTIRQHMEKIIS